MIELSLHRDAPEICKHIRKKPCHFEAGPWASSHSMQSMSPVQPLCRPNFFHSAWPNFSGRLDVRIDRTRSRGMEKSVWSAYKGMSGPPIHRTVKWSVNEYGVLTGKSRRATTPRPYPGMSAIPIAVLSTEAPCDSNQAINASASGLDCAIFATCELVAGRGGQESQTRPAPEKRGSARSPNPDPN